MVSVPPLVRLLLATFASSVTVPVDTPAITGTSLVPWMVTVTSLVAVPSKEVAVKLSVNVWPAPNCWMAACALFAV